MSQETAITQCCKSKPIWIFMYSDGNIIVICDKDFQSPAFRLGVEKVINIESQKIFTPTELFGGLKIEN